MLVRLAETLGVATVDLAPLRPDPTLHELRWHAGLSAGDLQARVGISRSALSEQLRGNARITCPTTLCRELSSPSITVTPAVLERAWCNSREAGSGKDVEAVVDIGPTELEEDGPAAAEWVREAVENLAAAERGLADAIAAMRADGGSWSAIGDVLGISRQAAWERFARRV